MYQYAITALKRELCLFGEIRPKANSSLENGMILQGLNNPNSYLKDNFIDYPKLYP